MCESEGFLVRPNLGLLPFHENDVLAVDLVRDIAGFREHLIQNPGGGGILQINPVLLPSVNPGLVIDEQEVRLSLDVLDYPAQFHLSLSRPDGHILREDRLRKNQ